jgi:hypothetical protein
VGEHRVHNHPVLQVEDLQVVLQGVPHRCFGLW